MAADATRLSARAEARAARYGHGVERRSSFSSAEIAEIKRLVREKQTAPTDRQKVLRAKLRKRGLYISDYAEEPGFVESDVDDLIRRGAITLND